MSQPQTDNHDEAFARFLARATELPPQPASADGVTVVELDSARRRRPNRVPMLAAAAVLLVAGIGGWILARQDDARVLPAGPIEAAASLTLDLDAVAVPAADGAVVTPEVGPSLEFDVVGLGTIEAVADGGRRFLPGGQQRDDYAILTAMGGPVANLFDAVEGQVEVVITPLVDMAERTTPTGRNINTYLDVVRDELSDQNVFGLSLNVDPEIGPYLSGHIRAVPFLYVLQPADIADFAASQEVILGLRWSNGVGSLVLNGRVVDSVQIPSSSTIVWTDSARLSIGGSANFGGGYFAIHDDSVLSVAVGVG